MSGSSSINSSSVLSYYNVSDGLGGSEPSLTSIAMGLGNQGGLSDKAVEKLAGDLKEVAAKVPGVDLSDGLSPEEIGKIKDYIKENGLEDQYKDLMKALEDDDLIKKMLEMINGATAPEGGGEKGGGEKGGAEKGGGGGGGGEEAGGKEGGEKSGIMKLDTNDDKKIDSTELAAADTDNSGSLDKSELLSAGLTEDEATDVMSEFNVGTNSVGSAGLGIEFSDILAKYSTGATEPVA